MKKTWKRWGLVCVLMTPGIRAQEIPDREIHYRPGDWISYPVTRFMSSVAVGHQYTYFGTTGGIARYDFFRNQWESPFTVSDGLENDHIRTVAYDFETGYIWCATESGLSYRIPSAEEWRNIFYLDLGIGPVSSIGSGKHYLWLKSSEELLKGDRSLGTFWHATKKEEIEDAVQWNGSRAGRKGESLPDLFMESGYHFFPQGYIQDAELRQFDVTETFRDNFDNLWMATWGLGSGVANMKTFHLKQLPFGPYTSEVNAMAWDDAGMWMGGRRYMEKPDDGESWGITWWDMDRNEWIYFEAEFIPHLRSDEVTSIAPDTTFVWIGTVEGLARYNKNRDSWQVFSVHDNLWDNRVTTLALGENVLWVGTEYGINTILLPGMVVKRVRDKRLVHRRIYWLEVDGEDVWAGTDRGIYRYVGKKRLWEYAPGYAGMLTQTVTAISVWEDEVWFGTDDGIEVYDRQQDQWRGFPAEHHPTGGLINNILADSGAVWIATENGVLKYIKKENRWRRFTTEDGLLDNSVRWILLDGDYIWFGTGRGLTRFYWNAPYRID